MANDIEQWLKGLGNLDDRAKVYVDRAALFFNDPPRSTFHDLAFFFSPADGIILYQKQVRDEKFDIKGEEYSVKETLQDEDYDKESLVISIFMTFFDTHINRIPYPGRLSYWEGDPLNTYDYPMLEIESKLLEGRLPRPLKRIQYRNERVINEIYSPHLRLYYYVVQIADYEVNCITPFSIEQNQSFGQGDRFSQVRFGSQVDLIIPLSNPALSFSFLQQVGSHVEAGTDPLLKVRHK